jgi:hypothetical protein
VSLWSWVLTIGVGVVAGLFALSYLMGRAAVADMHEMFNPRFTTMEFAELPHWVRERLAGLRDQFAALGFKELTNYTHHSSRMNYTCVFVSPDGLTQATAWVAGSRGLAIWVGAPFIGWAAFKNELLALPRFGLMTRFPDGRLFETSPVQLLATGHVAGETEIVIVPPGLPMGEVKERHDAAARAVAALWGTAPIAITSVEQFLDCERALSARLGNRLRQQIGHSGPS